MKSPKRKRLLSRLLFFILPLVAFSILLTGTVLSWSNYRHFKRNIKSNYGHILKSAAGEISFFMNSAREGLESLGLIISAAKMDPWQTDIALAAFVLKNDSFETATLYDVAGTPIASSNPRGEDISLPDRSYF